MAHPIGEVPHAGLEPDLFERFHREMVDIKNNRKYTYTQRLYDKGYSKSEVASKRTAINSKYNQKSLMTATTLRALEGLSLPRPLYRHGQRRSQKRTIW